MMVGIGTVDTILTEEVDATRLEILKRMSSMAGCNLLGRYRAEILETVLPLPVAISVTTGMGSAKLIDQLRTGQGIRRASLVQSPVSKNKNSIDSRQPKTRAMVD